MKGYYTQTGYMGYVKGKYMLFESETAYIEFMMGYFDLIDQGGAFIIMLPLGLYLLFTKEKVIM